ncbi:hypothetical protein DP68_01330 [Clostridium sp. HMP27]|nr:hypothetical protein DP68_01330 [Clostridium sp. HMP27]
MNIWKVFSKGNVKHMDFIIDTLFQIFFAFFWVIAFLIFLIKERNKKKYLFLIIFIPLLMIWTAYSYNHVLKPRLKDVSYYMNKDYKTTSGECSNVNTKSKGATPSFVLEGETYYYNPWFNKIHKDKNYKLRYLPNSKYVIELEEVK